MAELVKTVFQNKAEEKISHSVADNLSKSSSSNSGTKHLPSILTEVGSFSYASIVSLALHELFDNQWDKNFSLQCISVLMKHLNFSKEVESVMIELLIGTPHQNFKPYIDQLLAEPKLDKKAVLIIEDLLSLAISKGKYDARMRVLIQYVSVLFKIPVELVDLCELSIIQFLNVAVNNVSVQEQENIKKLKRKNNLKRYALIGLATVGGGVVLGLTGGLTAPLIGAGIGTFLGAGTAAVLGSVTGTAIVASLFGVTGAGLAGYKMKKRVGEVEEFTFGPLTRSSTLQTELHITIAISGWLSDEKPDNFARPWRTLLNSREQYFLRYESRYLLELGRAMDSLLSFSVSMVAQEALKHTFLSGIISAISWPASLVTLAGIIDNPWSVCCQRSAKVGEQLAEVLLSREQGQRPVTLIGFSLGARVIYYCLRAMSNRENCEGIIQDAILLGAPVTGGSNDWSKLTRVVAGRLINGFSKSDWLLSFLYRPFSVAGGVAGLQPIKCSDRKVLNVDLTSLVSGHSDYSRKIKSILKHIKIRNLDDIHTGFTTESTMKKSASDLPVVSVERSNSFTSLRTSRSVELAEVKK